MDNALERFIGKYNLGGLVDSVVINVDADGTTTEFITPDSSLFGKVTTKELSLPEGEFGVYDTRQLKSLLSVVGRPFKVKEIEHKSRVVALEFVSNNTKATFVLSNKANIPPTPKIKHIPDFEVVIDLTPEIMQTFIRGQSALPDNTTVSVISDSTGTSLILGYSKLNTNRVKIEIPAPKKADGLDIVNFSAIPLKEVFSANKDILSGTVSVSSEGMMLVKIKSDGFDSEYYLFEHTQMSI